MIRKRFTKFSKKAIRRTTFKKANIKKLEIKKNGTLFRIGGIGLINDFQVEDRSGEIDFQHAKSDMEHLNPKNFDCMTN